MKHGILALVIVIIIIVLYLDFSQPIAKSSGSKPSNPSPSKPSPSKPSNPSPSNTSPSKPPDSSTKPASNSIVDCTVGDWSKWGDCDLPCGGGSRTRTRPIITHPTVGGAACPQTTDTEPCNVLPCDVDCEVSDWSLWSGCTTNCGPGFKSRSRSIKKQAGGKGNPCPDLTETADCGNKACPVNCSVGEWSEWSPCDVSCGGAGTSRRRRNVLIHPANGGLECPATEQVKICGSEPCDKDCVVSDWSPWSACSASCGGGVQSRVRYIISPASGKGKTCPPLIEYRDCNAEACPTDCVVSEWSPWSNCSKPCGSGTQVRTRTIIKPSTYGNCPSLEEHRPCNYEECPVDCEVSDWSNWSECDATCGGGSKIRTREILKFPNTTGKACPSLIDSEDCGNDICGIDDCIVSAWSDWSPCGLCGNQTHYRTRTIIKPGKRCPPLREVQPCKNSQCPVECVVSDWSDWSECTATCDGGVQHRTRFILKYPENTSTPCPPLVETRDCNKKPCPTNCVLGPWSNWSNCSKSCEGGIQTRSRAVITPAANGGMPCGAQSDSKPCNTQVCDRDCQVSGWSAWSACSTSCDTETSIGTHSRTRVIIQEPTGAGKACPTLTETEKCGNQRCPINCVPEDWKPNWSDCSHKCGGGVRTRSRAVKTPAQFGGESCADMSQMEVCNTQPCPVDCIEDEWGEWSACDKQYNGKSTRTRGVKQAPDHGGKPCAELIQKVDCNVAPPAVDCVVSPWSGWYFIMLGVNAGKVTRDRTIITHPSYGGAPCPELVQIKAPLEILQGELKK